MFRNKPGILLIEVVVSIAIFSIGVVMLISLMSISIKYLEISTKKSKGLEICKEIAEREWSELEDCSLAKNKIYSKDAWTIQVDIRRISNEFIEVKKNRKQKVRVYIKEHPYIQFYEIEVKALDKNQKILAEAKVYKLINPRGYYEIL